MSAVVTPSDIPTPGTTYAPTRPGSRAKPRTVAWVGKAPPAMRRMVTSSSIGYRHEPDASRARCPDTGHDSHVFIGTWRAWVRKHAAVAVTP